MNYIKVLGASGGKAKGFNTTSFQVHRDIVIDAGNILNALGEDAQYINHIFITHSHADHISDLPFVIETFFEKREEPLTIYALQETIDILKKHTFNDSVWPDFTRVKLPHSDKYSLIFHTIEINETINIREYSIKAIYADHIEGSCGFVIKKENQGFLISGDTYKSPTIWEEINNDKSIKVLLLECSFPSRKSNFAKITKHLSPELIKEEIRNLKRFDIDIFFYHIKPLFEKEVKQELKDKGLLNYRGKILYEGDVIHIDTGIVEYDLLTETKFDEIMKINLEISSEKNKDKLLENILTLSRRLTNAQAGTLYIKSKDEKSLDFKVIQNDKLKTFMGGTKDRVTWTGLPIYLEDGRENDSMVAVICYTKKETINIENVYENKIYSFEGTKSFDKSTGYLSKSMIVIPLIDHEGDVIGVLQLINKTIDENIVKFSELDEKILASLASQAAITLNNMNLVSSLEEFINAYVSTIAKAIDAKSSHTKEHIFKVEKIALLLTEAIDKDKTIYKNVEFCKNDYKQIALAAWIHDIGKISIPEYILDKATKLDMFVNRIELIEQRFEIIKKDKEIEYLKNLISKKEFEDYISQMNSYLAFLQKINIGSEFMHKEDKALLDKISTFTYHINGEEKPLITQNEYYNLSIQKGTLNTQEIEKVRSHAQLSLDMISELPFPKRYKDVLDIACNHHEKLNGKGYPRGLNAEQISIKDRIMILADIFEALTTASRPYKKELMKLSQIKEILTKMANNYEIDKDLLEFFFQHEILKEYAKEELQEEQIDLFE